MGSRYAAAGNRGITDPNDTDPVESVTVTFRMKSGRKYKVRTRPDEVDHGMDYLSLAFKDDVPASVRAAHVYDGRFYRYTCWVKMYMTGTTHDTIITRQVKEPKGNRPMYMYAHDPVECGKDECRHQ